MPGQGKYVVTEGADSDLVAIAKYTRDVWGARQRDRYIEGLFRFFQQIADKPGLGRERFEAFPGLQTRLFRKNHHVYYRQADEVVEILAVLHVKQDQEPALGERRV